MTGEHENLDNDLSIASLTDDLEISIDDIGGEQGSLTTSLEDNKNTKTSEENETPESVAGEDDGKTPGVTEPNDGNSSPGGNLSQYYSSFANHLVNSGVLPNLNLEKEKIENLEQLQEAVRKQIDSSISDRQKAFEEAIKEGVPRDSYSEYETTKQQLEQITSDMITSQDEKFISLRRNIIGQDFLNRGFTKEEAIKYAQRSIDLGEDVSDATSALDRLKTHNEEQYQSSKQKAQEEKIEAQENFRKYIDNTDEILSGLKISKNIKDKLYNQIITPTGSDKKGNPVNEYAQAYEKDPVKFQVMQNYLYMLTKGFTDFSKLTNQGQTNASKEFDELLKNTNPAFFQESGIGLNNDNSDESAFTLGDGLSLDV